MNRAAMVLLWLAAGAACAEESALPEVPAAVTTAGGSRLIGLLANDRLLGLRTEKGTQKLDLSRLRRTSFGERFDPNLENEARLAVGDLQSEQFSVRDRAAAKLRSLGRSAAQALRVAVSSEDPEVAARARGLLSEMGLLNAGVSLGDAVILADGAKAEGTVLAAEFTLRSRWGRLKFRLQSLESIERLTTDEVNGAGLAPATETPVDVPVKSVAPEAGKVERLAHMIEDPRQRGGPALSHLGEHSILALDRAPNLDRKAAPGQRMVAVKAGDRLEESYAPWGVLLRATDANSLVRAAQAPEDAPGAKLLAQVANSDCEVSFLVPGSYNPKTGDSRPGGVTVVGALTAGDHDVGLAVYDKSGRQVGEVYSLREPTGRAPLLRRKYVGVRSTVPVVRARLFRTGEGKGGDLWLDAVHFSRIVPVDRLPGCASVWLLSGELLAGRLAGAAMGKGLSLRPEFAPGNAPPVQLPLEEIERFEPARPAEGLPLGLDGATEARAKAPMGTPHGVLLQNGESFRARLLKLDEANVLFLLPGGVELKLPRSTLRKIDLLPAAPDPGELSLPVTVGGDEKPGVDFRRKEEPRKDDPAPAPEAKGRRQGKPGGKKDVLQTTLPLEPMPDVEIIGADVLSGDLKIKDENGEWTIGLAPVKTLVFPKDPNARPAAGRRREWVLTLREGSRFEVALAGLSAESLTAEMAGGNVTLPWAVVESIERVKER